MPDATANLSDGDDDAYVTANATSEALDANATSEMTNDDLNVASSELAQAGEDANMTLAPPSNETVNLTSDVSAKRSHMSDASVDHTSMVRHLYSQLDMSHLHFRYCMILCLLIGIVADCFKSASLSPAEAL